jgi:hypothetical protein
MLAINSFTCLAVLVSPTRTITANKETLTQFLKHDGNFASIQETGVVVIKKLRLSIKDLKQTLKFFLLFST